VHGVELWKTDGTEAGTAMVKNIASGNDTGASGLLVVNGILFFRGDDFDHGAELWKSDGTAAGTVMVKDIFPGSNDCGLSSMIDLNGTLLFYARDGLHPLDLWKSDGTSGGTVLVKTIPGLGNAGMARVGNRVFFPVQNGSNYDLWKSDGTTAGTVIVKTFTLPPFTQAPQKLTDVNGVLYFSASDGSTGVELWKSDGTTAGTVLVKDINPTSVNESGSFPADLTNVNGTLFFSANDGTNGVELWKSDGTAGGTVMIKDINPGAASGVLQQFFVIPMATLNGKVFFRATEGTNGFEFWKSDGTAAGTVLVKDIAPGSASSLPGYTYADVLSGGNVFFIARDGTEGNFASLWKTDGTTVSTMRVKELPTGTDGSSPTGIVVASGAAPFTANGVVLFSANDGIGGAELWSSDGTDAGTTLVKEIRPGSDGSAPAKFTTAGNTMFFAADDGTSGQELWKTDGPKRTAREGRQPGAGSARGADRRERHALRRRQFRRGPSCGERRNDGGYRHREDIVGDALPGTAHH
jgi:ELWxxDGT repeat protein